jgi:hypothetical protein
MGLVSSCSINHSIAHYRTFSSTDPYLDFTFEYASNLNEDIQKYKEWPDSPNGLVEITLRASSYNIVVDTMDATSDNTAQNLQQDAYYQAKSWGDNFEVLKKDAIIIDGISGYELECNYDSIKNPISTGNTYVRLHDRFIFIQRDAKFYGIRFSVDASQSDSIQEFQHLLDTWKWK